VDHAAIGAALALYWLTVGEERNVVVSGRKKL